jgi:hypothetical protein
MDQNQKQNQEAIDSAAVQFIAGWNLGRIGSQPGRYSAAVRISTVKSRATDQASTFSRFLAHQTGN